MKLKLKTPEGRNDLYPLLRFKRPGEIISRIDKYSIMMYWDYYDENGNPAKVNELLFYPSEYGMDEIDNSTMEGSNISDQLKNRLDQLRKYANPWWRYDVKTILNKDNWILKYEASVSTFKQNKKPKLKVKSNNSKPKLKVKSNNKLKLKVKNNGKIKLKVKSESI